MTDIISSDEWLTLSVHMVPVVGVLLMASALLIAWEIHQIRSGWVPRHRLTGKALLVVMMFMQAAEKLLWQTFIDHGLPHPFLVFAPIQAVSIALFISWLMIDWALHVRKGQ